MSEQNILLNALQCQIWTMTDENTYGTVNETHARFHLKKPEDLSRISIHEVLPKETAASIQRSAAVAFRTGTVSNSEEWMADGSGRNCLLSISALPLPDRSGIVTDVICSALDITRWRMAESALLENREQFNQLARQNRTVVWEVDALGLFTFLSPVVREVLGYMPEELTGRLHFYDLHPEETREAFKESALDAFNLKKEFVGMVNSVLTRDGKCLIMSTSGIPLLNDDGSLRGYRGNDTDITRYYLAEESLRESEALYRATIDALDCFIHIIDREFKIIMMNRAFTDWCETLGISSKGTGLNLREQFRFLPDSVIGEYARVLESGESLVTIEETEVNGSLFITETRKVPITLAGGKRGVLTAINNITELKRAEEARRAIEGRYEQLADMVSEIIWHYETDASGVFLSSTISKAADQFLGLPPETINHSFDRFFSHVHPDDLQGVVNALNSGLQACKKDIFFDYRMIRFDGVTLFVRSHGSAYQLPGGGVAAFGITSDVTASRLAERIIRESEEKHRLLFQHAISAIAIHEVIYDEAGEPVDYSLIDANPAFETHTGIPVRDSVGHRITEVFPGIEKAPFFAICGNVVKTRTPASFECFMEQMGRHLHVNAYCMGEGHLAAVFTNVTEENAAKAALQASEARYHEVITSISDTIWRYEVNEEGNRVDSYMSPQAGKLLGIKEDIDFDQYFSCILRDDLQQMSEKFFGAIRSCEQNILIEFRACPVSGGISWISVRGSANRQPNGHIVASGTAIDITGEKLAEKALLEREEMYRVLVEGLPDLVLRYDSMGKHLFVSRNVAEMLDRKQSDILGKTHRELGLSEEVCLFWEESLRNVFNTGQSIETVFSFGDGKEPSTHNIRFVPEGETNGVVNSVLAICRDITRQVRDREVRDRLQIQLNQAQKMESIGRLAGGVAHDFNNMLGVILGYTEIALEQIPPDHPLWHSLQEVRKAGERSADLTHQLLAFARQQVIKPGVVNLNKSVEGMFKMLSRLIGEDIELVWKPDTELWMVMVDPAQVDHILVNLCINARDAIGGVGTVIIQSMNITADEGYSVCHPGFPPGDFVMLAVSDDGCGMDRDTIEKLFEPFFTTKALGRGTGLGLATGYGIVKQNNGYINVYSEPGVGTTFKVYLPRHRGKNEQLEAKTVQLPECGYETLLVVEDEPAILHLTVAMLDSLGYKVIAADTPEQALGFTKTYTDPIHLLLTDVVMPTMSGSDLAGRILNIFPDTRCLFMSGYTAEIIMRQSVARRDVNFLQKPFSKKDLASAVRNALDR